jgi:sugar/nucleoside kinase (ribokinase family)
LIYIDIHSLTLGRKRNGARFFRKPANWQKVVLAGDFIQVNRRELSVLTRESAHSARDFIRRGAERLYELIIDAGKLNNGIDKTHRKLIITDGSAGCYLVELKKDKVKIKRLPAEKNPPERGDTTGCGDCFSAGFIGGILAGHRLNDCARMGNKYAAERILNPQIYDFGAPV